MSTERSDPVVSAPGGGPAMDTRIDFYPTHEYQGPDGTIYKLRPGRAFPFGATLVPGGVNFSVFSSMGISCTLVLFERRAPEPMVEIPFPEAFRLGNVWSMVVFGLDAENIEYGYRIDGPFDAAAGLRFDKNKILLDPYAKAIGGRDVWGVPPDWNNMFWHRGRLVFEDFDWENDRPLEIPFKDLVIYETHVRSFTAHPSSGVRRPGTFAGLREKIPYLKALGVNCLELMPIYEFDEFENSKKHPVTGEMLYNYWGYSTVGFFAPKAGYAATGKFGMEVDELKTLIKELHANGIEVMLDVVFNHTAEGNEMGPTISYRGIDNHTYYMLTPEGYYYNFSGCGNTLNCNNPVVRNMVLDCLRYWAAEYHIDGFRFDLASILGRDPWGAPMANPPLLESLAFDPILGKVKLVAEAWDAGGMYQVGSFPAYGRWAEWNGKYRDDARKFLKGDPGLAGAIAQRVQGSPDLYAWNRRGATASINFIACHDGFTLYDIFAYNEKHNWANGENNTDGGNDNHSWNCGWEGETDDPHVNETRLRMMKNGWVLLLMSQGVPMVLMGDEVARTQQGNNNTYCHDNELNWFDWGLVEQKNDLLRFAKLLIAFRNDHHALRMKEHPTSQDVSFHGARAWNPDWSHDSRLVAFMLSGDHTYQGEQDDPLYVAMNMHWDGTGLELPAPPRGQWHVLVNTGMASPEDIFAPGTEPRLENQQGFFLGARSSVVLIAK